MSTACRVDGCPFSAYDGAFCAGHLVALSPHPEPASGAERRSSSTLRTCVSCARVFEISPAEEESLAEKGWPPPTHCPRCRRYRARLQREADRDRARAIERDFR